MTESVWDNRFRYVDELRKMGANVQVDGQVAVFEGVDSSPLHAARTGSACRRCHGGGCADGRRHQ